MLLGQLDNNYFHNLYPEGEISFDIKKGGDQLGVVVIIDRPGSDKPQRYFIKMHSLGRKESNSTETKPVDVLELIIYKILEKLNLSSNHLAHHIPKAKDYYTLLETDIETFVRYLQQ
ncbi:hypothetical protein C9374_005779 [Naegleria lovaniensis]|uniref:Uncharacterized protein n=1 Tax=Naegleria lovaniensis TaxID=51637 RepID=A0AA88GPA2_NAELO|nr:uncharacterized protein C9374_005779 [Naegleria lovaniensis]KAG2381987.1 hypothetical protein C9374_005779 [Naegleria lovaniensis]